MLLHTASSPVPRAHCVLRRDQNRPKEAVGEFSPPSSVKEVRSFVGLASYYRKFIPHFSRVAGPLHALTKKDVTFVWTPECQSAFEELKKLLTTAPLLSTPDLIDPSNLRRMPLGVDSEQFSLNAKMTVQSDLWLMRVGVCNTTRRITASPSRRDWL